VKVYLDTCVLSRLTDKPSHPRILAEAEAIEQIFQRVSVGELEWIASTVLEAEVRKNPNIERMIDSLDLLVYAATRLVPDSQALVRAHTLQTIGYGAGDALHLAVAEQGAVDVLLTTDDRFLRLTSRGSGSPRIHVENPVEWMKRV